MYTPWKKICFEVDFICVRTHSITSSISNPSSLFANEILLLHMASQCLNLFRVLANNQPTSSKKRL